MATIIQPLVVKYYMLKLMKTLLVISLASSIFLFKKPMDFRPRNSPWTGDL